MCFGHNKTMGAVGALTALALAGQRPKPVSPGQTVFSLKPTKRLTISAIFRIDSLAHLCPTPLCAQVQKLKPPPWPQERFRGEAPYREPLQPDTLARMELTGKKTLGKLGTRSRMAWQGRRWGQCYRSRRLGNPVPQEKGADPWISGLASKWGIPESLPKNNFLFIDPSTLLLI